MYLAQSKPINKGIKLSIRLSAINGQLEGIQDRLDKYEIEIENANRLIISNSARCSSRARTANSQNSKRGT